MPEDTDEQPCGDCEGEFEKPLQESVEVMVGDPVPVETLDEQDAIWDAVTHE